MAFSLLTKMTAFSAGANLWIVPDTEHCQWSRRIDWHLGFLMTRAKHHEGKDISIGLKEILTHCQIENLDFRQPADSPLLVSSREHLPNQMTVCLRYAKNKDWLTKVSEIWKSLNYPSLRIFLPEGLSPDELKKEWPHPGFETEISVVANA